MQEYAKLTDPSSVAEHDTSIAVIEVLMTLLTYGLLLSFGVVAIKQGIAKARSMDTKELVAKIRNLTSKKAKTPSGAQESRTTNAMQSGAGDLSFGADSEEVEESETRRLSSSIDNPIRENPDVRLEMRTPGKQAETSVGGDITTV